jgi:hypothetical protein
MLVYQKTNPFALTVTLLALLVLAGVNRAEEAKKTPPSPKDLLKAMAENGKPGPEHKKLEPFVGDWTFTLKVWTNPSESPAQLTGTVERKWVMGGRFVQETVKGQCSEGHTFEGLGLLGYDNAQKKFTATRACGLCGKTCSTVGTVNDSGKTFTFATEEYCPVCKENVKGRDEVVVESNDRIVVSIYKTIQNKEVKVIEIVNVRKK